jgi:hypothetical protein
MKSPTPGERCPAPSKSGQLGAERTGRAGRPRPERADAPFIEGAAAAAVAASGGLDLATVCHYRRGRSSAHRLQCNGSWWLVLRTRCGKAGGRRRFSGAPYRLAQVSFGVGRGAGARTPEPRRSDSLTGTAGLRYVRPRHPRTAASRWNRCRRHVSLPGPQPVSQPGLPGRRAVGCAAGESGQPLPPPAGQQALRRRGRTIRAFPPRRARLAGSRWCPAPPVPVCRRWGSAAALARARAPDGGISAVPNGHSRWLLARCNRDTTTAPGRRGRAGPDMPTSYEPGAATRSS